MQLTRRALLGLGAGAGAIAVTGCHGKSAASAPQPTIAPVVPDAAALAAARTGELALLAAYDRQIKHTPLHKRGPLQVERAIHATHLSALHGEETGAGGVVGDSIDHALRRSANRLRRLALSATLGANAALLASIAASHTASAS